MRSAVVCVGTELTDGQIVNRNSAWIAGRLKDLGLRCHWHLTVPDDRALIRESLRIASQHADWIFVTGGLGPTTDDFTRELIAEWCDRPLEFHEPSWKALVERLTSRGYPVQEFQRQQCLFPRAALVLSNSQGTAAGFHLHHQGKEIIVLPGPPREIEAIWNDHLSPWLRSQTVLLDPPVTRSWDVIGLGESQVAALIEPVVQSAERLQALEVGYRVHLPYVEVKLTLPCSQWASQAKLIEQIEAALRPRVALRDGEDAATQFITRLQQRPFRLHDQVTGSVLLNRLVPLLKNELTPSSWEFNGGRPEMASFDDLHFRKDFTPRAEAALAAEPNLVVGTLEPIGDNGLRLRLCSNRQWHMTEVQSPYVSSLMADRRRQYFAETALLQWSQWLSMN